MSADRRDNGECFARSASGNFDLNRTTSQSNCSLYTLALPHAHTFFLLRYRRHSRRLAVSLSHCLSKKPCVQMKESTRSSLKISIRSERAGCSSPSRFVSNHGESPLIQHKWATMNQCTTNVRVHGPYDDGWQ